MSVLREVAPGVMVSTSRNDQTNSIVLAGEGEALLVDPAWMPDELDNLATAIDQSESRVIGGFATHAHHDHLLWHPRFGEVPRWSSAETARLAEAERFALVDQLGDEFPSELAALMGQVTGIDTIPAASIPAGFEVELITHDGHAPGHTALWLSRQRILIAGDMLSDAELPLPFDPDDLGAYLSALDLLTPYARAADLVIPGHGRVGTDAAARLEADRRYLGDPARSADPRLGNRGMADVHARILRLVGDRR